MKYSIALHITGIQLKIFLVVTALIISGIGFFDMHINKNYTALGILFSTFGMATNLAFWILQISIWDEEKRLPKFSFKK